MSSDYFNRLSRRDFIKHFGVAAGLAPFLRSEVAMGQAATAPTRLLVIPLQHGWGINKKAGYAVSGTETSFTLPPSLTPLNAIKNQCVFVQGLRTSFWGNAHDTSYTDILTSSTRWFSGGSFSGSNYGGPFPPPSSSSIDWQIGNQFKKNVLRMSVNYSSWGAAYHPLCFDSSLRSLPFNTSASAAFNEVVTPIKNSGGGGGVVVTPPATSGVPNALLSYLGKDLDKLMKKLSGTEKSKLESYLAALNSLGTKIGTSTTTPTPTTMTSNYPLPAAPGSNLNFSSQIDYCMELIKVAFAYDTHRVAVLGLGEGTNDFTWQSTSGAARVGNTFGNDFHHECAHWQETGNPDSMQAYDGWARWYAQKVANLVTAMSNITDVDGRKLIDNTIIVLTGEVGDGNHDTLCQMLTVIGGGGNKIRRGRYLNLPTVTYNNKQGIFIGSLDAAGNRVTDNGWGDNSVPIGVHHASDLWTTIAQLCGLPITKFGLDVYNQTPISLS